MFKVKNKNFLLNRLKKLFVITVLTSLILINSLNLNPNKFETSYENSYGMMACAGTITWEAFAVMAVSTIVLSTKNKKIYF